MSSLDIEKLLLPISEETPCGEDLEYDPAVMDIEKELEGKSEQQMGDSVIEAEEPDWKKIYSDSTELLERTHDIRVLMFMIRGGMRTQGFSVFSDVFSLLSGWVETQWDALYPLLDADDDDDPTERINVIMTLCDFEAILKPLVSMPVVESDALGKFSLKDIRIAQEGGGEPNLATIDGAFTDSDLEQLENRSEQLKTSIDLLDKIETDITEQVGISNAPSLGEFVKILSEILTILSEYVAKKGGTPIDGVLEAGDESELESVAGGRYEGGSIGSSYDAMNALDKIIEYYMKNEPSSPVPMLLDRAKRLANMDFMSIIRDIAPEGESQAANVRGPIEGEGEEDEY